MLPLLLHPRIHRHLHRAALDRRAHRARIDARPPLTYGAYAGGVGAAIFDDNGTLIQPWLALGGASALIPAGAATADGFAVVVEDAQPNRPPPQTPYAASCECLGELAVDALEGGIYAYELAMTNNVRRDKVALGVVQDGHLPGGHYHGRQVLGLMHRAGEHVIAAGQAIDMEPELFIGGRDTWTDAVERLDARLALISVRARIRSRQGSMKSNCMPSFNVAQNVCWPCASPLLHVAIVHSPYLSLLPLK